ncbi:MAG: hypothetical protein GF329_20595 [Candidatus Lokiarchaeota archaeon]|nr:hypothetical protein [Candidatus Lokiarchaeota archaeon]
MIDRSEISFGLASLDKLLGGGLSPGCPILMVSDHASTRKTAFMGYFALEQLIKDQGKVFVIEYLYPPHLFYQLPDFLSSPSFFQDIVKNRRYIILNCYGDIGQFPPEFRFKDSIINMSSPNDLSKLRYQIEKLRRDNIPEGVNARWVFDDITSMIVTVGDENKVLKFIKNIFHFLRRTSDLGLFYIERKAHTEQLMAALEDLAGAIIYLDVKEMGESLIPHLRVVKNRGFGSDVISSEIPYLFTRKGISLKTGVLEDFETIKKHLTITQNGIMELFDSQHMIIPRRMYLDLVKALYKNVNYETYNKITYKLGKNAGKEMYPFFSTLIRTRSQFNPADLINVFNSFGIGKTEILKMDLRRGFIHIRMYNLARWDSAKPVHGVISGLIAACIELFTRKSWKCTEVKCSAIGVNSFCEFMATPEEELGYLVQDLQSLKSELKIDKNGGLTLKGSRAILISNENVVAIINSIKRLTNKKLAKEIQYNMGKEIALHFGKFVTSKYNIQGEGIFNFWTKVAGTRGWGSFNLEFFDPEEKKAHLKVENTILGSMRAETGEMVDDLTAGIIAGLFEYITNDKLICKEVKCVSKGDEICEFIVRPED